MQAVANFLAKIVSFHLKFQNKVTVNFLHPSICELLFLLLQFARNVSSCKFPHKVESKKDSADFPLHLSGRQSHPLTSRDEKL